MGLLGSVWLPVCKPSVPLELAHCFPPGVLEVHFRSEIPGDWRLIRAPNTLWTLSLNRVHVTVVSWPSSVLQSVWAGRLQAADLAAVNTEATWPDPPPPGPAAHQALCLRPCMTHSHGRRLEGSA